MDSYTNWPHDTIGDCDKCGKFGPLWLGSVHGIDHTVDPPKEINEDFAGCKDCFIEWEKLVTGR